MTLLAVVPHCVVLAGTHQSPVFALQALAGVTVALTSDGGNIGQLCKRMHRKFSNTLWPAFRLAVKQIF